MWWVVRLGFDFTLLQVMGCPVDTSRTLTEDRRPLGQRQIYYSCHRMQQEWHLCLLPFPLKPRGGSTEGPDGTCTVD